MSDHKDRKADQTQETQETSHIHIVKDQYSLGDDEYYTIGLKKLLEHRDDISEYEFVSDIVPVLCNYELNAGYVFQLAIIPITYHTWIEDIHSDFEPNNYRLRDHLEIDCTEEAEKVSFDDLRLAFTANDYKRIMRIISPQTM